MTADEAREALLEFLDDLDRIRKRIAERSGSKPEELEVASRRVFAEGAYVEWRLREISLSLAKNPDTDGLFQVIEYLNERTGWHREAQAREWLEDLAQERDWQTRWPPFVSKRQN